MSLPAFNEHGALPAGIHTCLPNEFVKEFCGTDHRRTFYPAFREIIEIAQRLNATFVYVGGSFVTKDEMPGDLDMVIVFPKRSLIPSKTDRYKIEGHRVDVMVCSEEDPEIVNSFLSFLGINRVGRSVGIVQVLLPGSKDWKHEEPDEKILEIVKATYINRVHASKIETRGIIVTIHGIRTHAPWNNWLTTVASSQGWTVAPYNYGYKWPIILASKSQQAKVLEDFRDWIFNLHREYPGGISIIAHSFGTYVIGAYLDLFSNPPVKFDSMILTGSILNRNYDWNKANGKVKRVRHEIAPNDFCVRWMPNYRLPFKNRIFGNSGVKGFNNPAGLVEEHSNAIFGHNNVIKKDVVVQWWMPFLNSHRSVD